MSTPIKIKPTKPKEQKPTKIKPIKIKEDKPIKIKPIKIKPIKIKTLKIKEPKLNKKKTLKIREHKDKTEENSKTKEMIDIISNFKKNGISVIESLSEQQLTDIIKYSNDQYYNTNQSVLTDNEYDIIREYTEQKYPKNTVIKNIGAPVERNKVNLPYEMPSMDKIKPDSNALSSWKMTYKGNYVISCKLDGVSGLYVVENDIPKLYTRGDGKVGQDISHLLPILKLPLHNGYAIRGEFIIPKKLFEDKYKSTFSNPRNLVSGIINSKKTDAKTQDLHFVTYEVIHPAIKPSEQISKLIELKHEVVKNDIELSISNESLSEKLLDWRTNYDYEIDGIIVTDNNIYPRISGNPDHSFAFKMIISDQIAECKVVDVIWSPSKNGYLKPRVRIEPVSLGGVNIEYATGFNGKFIEDNKIGIGAIIQIIRSGDVIPYIKSVTIPAEHTKMPNVPYVWTDTHVDIILENFSDDITVREKNATGFFVELGVAGLSSGNIKRLFKSGFDSISKIINMKKTDWENIDGFKEKMSEKIHTSIKEKISNATLLNIMVASNKLGKGLGERKIKPMIESFPTILSSCENNETKIKMLQTIKGIGKENATEFVENIPMFLLFIKECGLEDKLNNVLSTPSKEQESIQYNIEHPLYKKKIVMTKIRDDEIIQNLKKYGAILEDSMKKDIFVLIVKSKEDTSNKTEFAKKNNIQIMTVPEFKQAYLL